MKNTGITIIWKKRQPKTTRRRCTNITKWKKQQSPFRTLIKTMPRTVCPQKSMLTWTTTSMPVQVSPPWSMPGTARRTLTSENAGLTPMYTPGFAAPEQYGGAVPLGPWTDIYAVGDAGEVCGMARFSPPPVVENCRLAGFSLWPGWQIVRLFFDLARQEPLSLFLHDFTDKLYSHLLIQL